MKQLITFTSAALVLFGLAHGALAEGNGQPSARARDAAQQKVTQAERVAQSAHDAYIKANQAFLDANQVKRKADNAAEHTRTEARSVKTQQARDAAANVSQQAQQAQQAMLDASQKSYQAYSAAQVADKTAAQARQALQAVNDFWSKGARDRLAANKAAQARQDALNKQRAKKN